MFSWFERKIDEIRDLFFTLKTEIDPKHKLMAFYNFNDSCAKLVHIGIFSTLQNGIMTKMMGANIATYYSLVAYSVYYYNRVGEQHESLSRFCIFGMCMFVSIQFVVFLR